MSAAPTPYTKNSSYATLAATPITTSGLPGAQLDSEFTEIATALTETQARLAELQRDDGAIRNGVVGLPAMSEDFRTALAAAGSNYLGQWNTGTGYSPGDIIISNTDNYPYLCGFAHTSSGSFITDYASGVWAILGYRPTTDTLVVNTFSGTGSQTAFSLTKNPAAANNTQVYVAGVYQKKSTYSIVGTSPAVLTFVSAPAFGTNNIEVVIGVSAEIINSVVTIPNNSVGTNAIIDLNVTTGKLADGGVTALKIATDAVETAKIKDLNVTTAKLAALAVTGEKIAGGAIDSTKLATNAVQTANIQPGAVDNGKLATDAVETAKIKDGNVTVAKLATDAVETAKIKDGNVTVAKLATDAVETAKIKDGNVTVAKLATDAVETAKIKDGNVTATKLSGRQTGDAPIYGIRAWARFNGAKDTFNTPSTVANARLINASGNIISITRVDTTSTSGFNVLFATAMPDANYMVTGADQSLGGGITINSIATTGFTVNFSNAYGTYIPTFGAFSVIR